MDSNFTFRINQDLLNQIKKLAEKKMMSVSDIIRQALLKYMKDNKD